MDKDQKTWEWILSALG